MNARFVLPPRRVARHSPRSRLLRLPALAAATLAIGSAVAPAHAEIFGTLSNFDCYFTPPSNPMDPSRNPSDGCEGAEIELEGVHASSIGGSYPAHYANRTITEYNDEFGNFAGTRITYTGYNFTGAPTPGTLLPNSNPASTNGHMLVNSAGGEHFGFWINSGGQPTAQRFYWLDKLDDDSYKRVTMNPVIVPGPTWHFVPPANPGNPPVVQAVIRVPEPVDPPEVPEQRPDSTWVKVYKVKLDKNYPGLPNNPAGMQELLLKLISDANPENDVADVPHNDIVPEGEDLAEVETEWELLEGGKNIDNKEKMDEDEVDEDVDRIILRRYEFYEYAGDYDDEHEPFDPFLDIFDSEDNLDPNDIVDGDGNHKDLVGNFISANMVAAVLNPIPEPTTAMLLVTVGGLLVSRRKR